MSKGLLRINKGNEPWIISIPEWFLVVHAGFGFMVGLCLSQDVMPIIE
jgi:hypothetical protein